MVIDPVKSAVNNNNNNNTSSSSNNNNNSNNNSNSFELFQVLIRGQPVCHCVRRHVRPLGCLCLLRIRPDALALWMRVPQVRHECE